MPDSLRIALMLLALGLVGPASAAEPLADGRPIIPGFERFFEGPDADLATGGRLLVGELGCASCHGGLGGNLAPVARKQAPILDRVGARVRSEHLRAYLSDPRGVRPGTTMPDLLAGLPKEEVEAKVEALVHFLASTGSVAEAAPDRKRIGQGRTLYEQSGCAACHGSTSEKATPLPTTVGLGDVAGKYGYPGLVGFLQDPLAVRPSGRMPAMNLKPAEAQAVASFLLRDSRFRAPPNLAYRYYEGEWSELPDFDKQTPVASGMSEGFDVGVARRHENYALRYEGVLDLDRAGDYRFHLASDDGSNLLIDGKLVVNNDGIHPNQRVSSRTPLTKGRHQVVVGFFQGGGEEELEVEYDGPGLPRRSLSVDLLPVGEAPQPAPGSPGRFVVDPVKAKEGRALFASIGCASCHQLRAGGSPIAARPASKPLAELRAEAGCLAEKPTPGLPHFGLSGRQRVAIAAALRAGATEPTEKEGISRTLLAFNCYACHVRDGVGGVEEGRDLAFATTQKEMGEEGRIPPLLTGVGGKLTEGWLRHVLADGAKDRPYMLTRMPKFGERNVGHLVGPMASLDAVAPVAVPDLGVSERKAKATGRHIVGGQAFNCGSCHQFKEYQAAGIQALDMTLMTRRLRRDWFVRYVIDPQAFRPGTRMPAAWPRGKSQLDSIYGGDTARQLESVWLYLSDGPDAAVPLGVGREPIPLVADKGPVLYRNFIQGAGPRAIGVGYPEKANLAFDANDLRLALIWQGAFIDASKHWTGRGEGFQGPLGDNVLGLPTGPTVAHLPDLAAGWPAHKATEPADHFRGYRLDSTGRPAFLYDVGEVRVEDFPEAISAPEGSTFRRTLDLAADRPVSNLYLRAAVGTKVVPAGDGWYSVDGEWKVRVSGGPAPIVRESGGKLELIVPVLFEAGKARLIEEYAW